MNITKTLTFLALAAGGTAIAGILSAAAQGEFPSKYEALLAIDVVLASYDTSPRKYRYQGSAREALDKIQKYMESLPSINEMPEEVARKAFTIATLAAIDPAPPFEERRLVLRPLKVGSDRKVEEIFGTLVLLGECGIRQGYLARLTALLLEDRADSEFKGRMAQLERAIARYGRQAVKASVFRRQERLREQLLDWATILVGAIAISWLIRDAILYARIPTFHEYLLAIDIALVSYLDPPEKVLLVDKAKKSISKLLEEFNK